MLTPTFSLLLGLGDRHSDNIMVSAQGHLFHIDFGHFLGNFKTKFGIKRERENFVFTPAMAYVMGGTNFRKSDSFKFFQQHCVQAYNILRKNARYLISLFMLVSTFTVFPLPRFLPTHCPFLQQQQRRRKKISTHTFHSLLFISPP